MTGNLLTIFEVKRAAVVFFIIIICFHTVSSLQVCALVGGELLLPCVFTKLHQLPQRFTVFWKDRDQRIILDFIDGTPKFQDQDQRFRGRVKSFPDLCKEGNFSILLEKLQKSDSSSYECFSPKLDFSEMINLTVSDKCGSGPPRTPRSSAGDTRLSSGCLHLILSLILLFLTD